MSYNWELSDWPRFTYQTDHLLQDLLMFQQQAGTTRGLVEGGPGENRELLQVELLIREAMKTSAIEGEFLSREDVSSSILNQLGAQLPHTPPTDQRSIGIGEMVVDVRTTFKEPLSQEMLFHWHRLLMKGNRTINAGSWRSQSEPMQIVSGRVGHEIIHFEAPPSDWIPDEMERFILWYNRSAPGRENSILHPPIWAGLAHLYFESIHPFEDGNGRIGRAIAEKAISQGVGWPVLLSLSSVIEANRADYYAALTSAQRTNQVTEWLEYFLSVCLTAQQQAVELVYFTLQKTRFFDRFRLLLSPREKKVVERMMAEGPQGFEGGMSARKYQSITRVSKATATRDLQRLVELGVFVPIGEGRSRRYELKM